MSEPVLGKKGVSMGYCSNNGRLVRYRITDQTILKANGSQFLTVEEGSYKYVKGKTKTL